MSAEFSFKVKREKPYYPLATCKTARHRENYSEKSQQLREERPTLNFNGGGLKAGRTGKENQEKWEGK